MLAYLMAKAVRVSKARQGKVCLTQPERNSRIAPHGFAMRTRHEVLSVSSLKPATIHQIAHCIADGVVCVCDSVASTVDARPLDCEIDGDEAVRQ